MSSMHVVAFIINIHIHMHIYAVTNLLMLYFWIKLIMKMPKFLTTIARRPGQNYNWFLLKKELNAPEVH